MANPSLLDELDALKRRWAMRHAAGEPLLDKNYDAQVYEIALRWCRAHAVKLLGQLPAPPEFTGDVGAYRLAMDYWFARCEPDLNGVA